MPLSELQRRVALLILELPEADGFALAGGAALIVHDVSHRTTNDIDCFGPSVAAVEDLVPAAIEALVGAGYRVDVLVHTAGFGKLVVGDGVDRVQVDIGFDPSLLPPVQTAVGATRDLRDLAGDKLLALFGRAAARDFLDVEELLGHFTRDEMVDLARQKDLGFSLAVLADAFAVLRTYDRDDEFPQLSDEAFDRLRATFESWEASIRSQLA